MKHNYLETTGLKPQATEIEKAEIAVNLVDGTLFTKDHTGTVIPIGGSTSTGDIDFHSVPKTIESGTHIVIAEDSVLVHPSLTVEAGGSLTIETGAELFVPSGGTVTDDEVAVTLVTAETGNITTVNAVTILQGGETIPDNTEVVHNTGDEDIAGVKTFTDGIVLQGESVTPFTGFKNYIINGGLDVWQRGTSFNVTTTRYTADRWQVTGANNTTLVRALVAETQGYGMRITSSVSDNFVMGTRLEDVSRFSGKTMTLSFKARSPNATNIRAFGYYYDTSNSLITTGLIGTSLTISNTLTNYAYTFTVPDLSASTLKGETSSFYVRFDNAAIQDVDITITDVQLEDGVVATTFEQRPIGLELSLCQRYYEISNTRAIWTGNIIASGSRHILNIRHVVQKRITPSLTFGAVGTAAFDSGSFTSATISKYGFDIQCIPNATSSRGFFSVASWTSDAEF